MKPDVTIGIVVYNGRKTIERALDSALAQTFGGRLEIVVVDDGSTDNTFTLCRAYALRFPDYVRALRVEHAGVGGARNRVITEANGTYLTWLDADDYYFPRKIEQQYKLLLHAESQNPHRKRLMLFSRYRMNKTAIGHKQWMQDSLKHVLTGEFRAYLWASLARRSYYEALGGFNTKLHRSEDQDFLIRFLQNRGRIVTDEGDPLMQYHFSTNRSGAKVEESLNFILKQYSALLEEKGVLHEFLPRRYWEIAGFYKSNRNWDDMWRCRALAIEKDFQRFFPLLMAEMVQEMKTRDDLLEARLLQKLSTRTLDGLDDRDA